MRWNERMLTVAALGAVLAGGCATPEGDNETSRLLCTPREIERFLRTPSDPREFAITIQQNSDDRPVLINANRTRPGFKAIAPLVSPAGFALPLIEGRAGEDGATCLILTDTTSADSWTSMDHRFSLGLVPLGPPRIATSPGHVTDNVTGALCVMPRLVVDQLPMEAVTLFARAAHGPLWPLSRAAEANKADIVFGWNLLRSFAYVQWDFANRVIVLSATTPYDNVPAYALATIPLEQGRLGMVVKGSIEGRVQSIMLDVAGDFELAMAEPPMALVRQVALDDVVMLQVHAASSRELGLGFTELPRVGTRLLSKYRVTLDNRRNEVIFEIPNRPGTLKAPGR